MASSKPGSNKPRTEKDSKPSVKAGESTSHPDERSTFSPDFTDRHKFEFVQNKSSRDGVPTGAIWMLVVFVTVTGFLFHQATTRWIRPLPVPYTKPLVTSPPMYPSPRGGTEQDWKTAYDAAVALVAEMTVPEMVNVTTGVGEKNGFCLGNTGPVDRLGIPELCLQDGPIGLRFADNSTAWPAPITIGMTWDKALARKKGELHGQEAFDKGVGVLLGPTVGALGRSPYGGRNWEGFGADPSLQAILGRETIEGVQSRRVISAVKHLVGNEQEHFRRDGDEWAGSEISTPAVSANIDDRTMHELYLWPFAEAVRAGVGAVMCSYNQVNNSLACQNSAVLNGLLKDELGFQGFVVSDWRAQRSGVASARAGLDMTMPGDGLGREDRLSLFGSRLTEAVVNGSVPLWRVQDMTARILAARARADQLDKSVWPDDGPNFSSWTNERDGWRYFGSRDRVWTKNVNRWVHAMADHASIARQIAADGTVLLKNEAAFLPLGLDGLSKQSRSGRRQTVGRIGVFGDSADFSARPAECVDMACNGGHLIMGWGSASVDPPYMIAPLDAIRARVGNKAIVTAHLSQDIPTADELDVDTCLVFLRANSGEGYKWVGDIKGDRNHLEALDGGNKLAEAVARGCPNTVVVVNSVGPIITVPWADFPSVRAIVWANLGGQESGSALADVLFGDVNPSGKLTYTIARNPTDHGPSAPILTVPEPGTGPGSMISPQQDFTEGVFIDYRWFDKNGIEPWREFGFGLSYTTFALDIQSVKVDVDNVVRSRPLALPRPKPDLLPPSIPGTVPSRTECMKPSGFNRLREYVYPWLTDYQVNRLRKVSNMAEKYPNLFSDDVVTTELETKGEMALSPAGGGSGGNPDLWTQVVRIKATISNTGSMDGRTVLQLYVSLPNVVEADGTKVEMPVRVLRNFQKTDLLSKHSGKQTVEMGLTRRDLSYWDINQGSEAGKNVRPGNWVIPDGKIGISLGFSSRDIVWKGEI